MFQLGPCAHVSLGCVRLLFVFSMHQWGQRKNWKSRVRILLENKKGDDDRDGDR